MSTRYCSTCATEVEDVDGFCLLGHSLRVSAITDSMDELRAEVDHAFAAARAELASMSGRGPGAAANTGAQRPPAPPAPAGRPESGPSAPPSPPAPPPPVESSEHVMPNVWQAFEHELAGTEPIESGDPISMFAPSPRMDWGPEKPSVFRLPALRRPSRASA